MPKTKPHASGLSIAAVERDCGIGKDTLRVWERRYGFPTPGRDELGDRVYATAQMEKLRLIKRLIEAGHRPGNIVPATVRELKKLSNGQPKIEKNLDSTAHSETFEHLLSLLKTHEALELQRVLRQHLLREGLQKFVLQIVSPLTRLVGNEWMRGELKIFEEHLYTQCIQTVLRQAISNLPERAASAKYKRVVLTTLPQEPHGLGLLMAEAMFALEGCDCVNLGTQMPMQDIALAAKAHRASIVALSFSSHMKPNHVRDGLKDLRAHLPREFEIWAGGSNSALQRKAVEGVSVLQTLESIQTKLQSLSA
jgi:methanogenic corrinoid protein MtbC1